MVDEPTRARMEALEKRLSERRRAEAPPPSRSGQGYSGVEIAYRMVIELMAGIAIGLGIGYGLDRLFGTTPWLMVPFTLLGFAAGINVMLRTAKEIGPGTPGNEDTGKRPDDARD